MNTETKHSIEKIGGTSMLDYQSVKDNIILYNQQSNDIYNRVFVVSAYGGITDALLEHKKSGKSGVYALFSSSMDDKGWLKALLELREKMIGINESLFADKKSLAEANQFINERLDDAKDCLTDLQSLCVHGHFSIQSHLATVREMLASLGEAHSAWNTAKLLQRDGVNAVFVDLTGWNTDKHISLDERINMAFSDIDLTKQLPIVTGYAHSDKGLMSSFNRGYSEMTFSRLAVLTNAAEAVIHKEFHLSR